MFKTSTVLRIEPVNYLYLSVAWLIKRVCFFVVLIQNDDDTYSGLREYELVRAADYKCVSVQGTTQVVHGLIEDAAKQSKTILLDRGTHSNFYFAF
jgi:hypothetical protein